MPDIVPFIFDIYMMHLAVLTALWITILLFYWQYRECNKSRGSEEKLKERNEELSCFVYGAAHDLKAPLRAIGHLSCRLEEGLHKNMTPEQREDLVLLQQRVKRAEQLVDDLLEYWQAGKSWIKLHSAMTDAHTLVRDCIGMLSSPDDFTIDIDPALVRIRVYQLPLQQVMVNLIENAIKHHHGSAGKITVLGWEEKKHYRFSVSDDGPGIPEEYHDKIFETFSTLKSRDEVEGSGLGLSLVKRIVERQGGHVMVKKAPEGGALFEFTWPKKQIF